MAKSSTILVKMTSTGTMPDGSPTGTFFVIKKNPKSSRGVKGKYKFRRYDRRIGKHVIFEEKKMPPHSK